MDGHECGHLAFSQLARRIEIIVGSDVIDGVGVVPKFFAVPADGDVAWLGVDPELSVMSDGGQAPGKAKVDALLRQGGQVPCSAFRKCVARPAGGRRRDGTSSRPSFHPERLSK